MKQFKRFKLWLLAVVLFAGSGVAWGQLLLTEPFNYPPHATDGLAKQSSGVWKKFNSGDSLLVESGNLSYSGLPTSTGNKVTFGGAGTDYYTSFASQTSGTVYMSFLMNITDLGSLTTTGGYPIGFIDGGTSNFASRLWIRLSGTSNFNLGINAGSVSSNTAWASNTLSTNTTYLVVISYQFVSGNSNDISKIWINPVLGNSSEPTAQATSTNSSANDNANIQRVFLRQDATTSTPGTIQFDEIRVGTTWASVTPAATISTPTAQASDISFSNISQTGMTASWTNGDGAKRVVIMNTSNSFTDPTDGTDPTANTTYSGSGEQVVYNGSGNSVAITGLTAGTTYWFRVYEYNGTGTETKYLTSTATDNPKSQITSALTPSISVSETTLSGFTYEAGNGPSTEQTFTVSGSNLTADISIAAPTNYEISKTSGSGYTTPLTFTQSGGTVTEQTVYVRLKAGLSAATYNGETISITSTGADTKTITCNGSVTVAPDPEPTNHATTFTATANSSNQITVTWTDATGGQVPAGYLVKASTGTPTAPVDGTPETDGTLVKNITQGTQTVVFTGLSASTTYNFSIWPYTNSGTYINYKTDGTVPTASATTQASLYNVGDFGFTATSGTWGTTNANWKQWDGSGWNTTPTSAPTANDNVFILSGKTCSLDASGKNCKSLTVEAGAKLFGDGTANEYINVYGNQILCSGIIGNGTTVDGICFNIEGESCTISGDGNFDAFRIRKNSITSPAVSTTNLTINKNINLRYGGTAIYNAISNSTFNITLNEGYVLSLLGDGTTIGSIAVNGTNGASGDRGGTVTINGTLNVTGITYLTSNSTTLPVSFIIGSTGVVNANVLNCTNSGTAGHTLTINNGGKLNFNGSTTDVWGTVGTTNNAYNFNSGSIIEYSYAGAQTIKSPAAYSNLIITGNGIKSIEENLIVNNDLTINTGAILNVSAGKQLTVGGALTNNGTLNLKSTTDGTATIITNSTVSGTNYVVEQNLSAVRNWYMSSPVTGAKMPAVGYWYKESVSTGNWISVTTDTTMIAGRGYIVIPGSTGNVSFSGALNNGNQSIGLTRTTTNTTYKGFNLVGNPYPSFLDAAALLAANSSSVDNNIWYRTHTGDAYQFQTYNSVSDVSVPKASNGSYIPPMQAFWVRAKANNVNLNFTNAMRKHNDSADVIIKLRAPKAPTADRQYVRLQVSNTVLNDELLLYSDANASNAYDKYDAPKMMNTSNSSPAINLYTTVGSENLVIDGRNTLPLDVVIPVTFTTNAYASGSYSISANELTNLPSGVTVRVIDNGVETSLNDGGTYTFTADAGTTKTFGLILRSPGAVTGVENGKAENFSVYANTNGQLVIMAPVKSTYTVYNAVGQLIQNGKLNSEHETLNTKLSSGVYVVKTENHSTRVIVK